jgi:4-carboxymuconolactone decarboxylase
VGDLGQHDDPQDTRPSSEWLSAWKNLSSGRTNPLPGRRSSFSNGIGRFCKGAFEFAEQVVYGEVWERPGLSKRDRSLITLAILVAVGRENQLRGYLERALGNGVSKDEIGELIAHLAFCAGWPAR